MKSRAHLVLVACFVMAALPIAAIADSQSEPVLDTALYFSLGKDTVFFPGSTTDTNLQRAAIGLAIDYNRHTYDTMLAADVVFTYDTSSLQFLSVDKTSKWNGRLWYDTASAPNGIVKIHLDSGHIKLDTLVVEATQWLFADLVFKLKCKEENYEGTSFNLTYAGPDTNTATYSTGITGYASSSHCTAGSVTVADYQATFSAATRSLTDAWNTSNYLAVLAQTNTRTYSFKHRMVIDRTKFTIDSVKYKNAWSGGYPWWNGDTLSVWAYGNVAEKPSADTLYKIWFKPSCDAALRETLPINFIASKSWWTPSPGYCAILSVDEAYVNGQANFPDSAAVQAYGDGGQPVVGKISPHYARFKVKLRQSVDAAYRSGQGFAFAVAWDRAALDSMGEVFEIDSCPEISPGINAVITPDGGLDKARVYQNAGGDTLWATSSFADRLAVVFKFDTADFHKITWDNRWIAPKFVDSAFGSFTQVPVLKCPSLYLRDTTTGYRWGSTSAHKFDDSIKIKMAQPGTDSVTSTKDCISQKIRIRSNFDLAKCSLVVHCSSYVWIESWSGVRAGLTVSRITSEQIAIYGILSTSIGASDVFTNLLTVKMYVDACIGSDPAKEVGLEFDHVEVYSSTGSSYLEEYVARKYPGRARIDCNPTGLLCPNQNLQQPEDSLAKSALPHQFALSQNYPNPFNPVTTISLTLPKVSDWRITIFNSMGQVVKDFSGVSEAGTVDVVWNASGYASGVYLYRAEAAEFRETRKMLLLK